MTGNEISAAKTGINSVLEMKCFNGILDENAKMNGIMQINAKYEREKMNSETTIMKTITASFASGFMLCSKPGLLLRSSM